MMMFVDRFEGYSMKTFDYHLFDVVVDFHRYYVLIISQMVAYI